MKSRFIKGLAIICTVISIISLNGCTSNSTTNTEKENANLKDETSSDYNNSENNIILLENERIAAVLSEKERNPQLEEVLKEKYNLNQEAAKKIRYYYNYVDLDEDGVNEIIAEVVGVGSKSNEEDEDNVVIYKDINGALEEVDDFKLRTNPIIISDEKTNGWRNIIIESSDGGSEKKYAVLKYDGDDYSDVNESEIIGGIKDISGVAIISNDISKDLKDGNVLYLG